MSWYLQEQVMRGSDARRIELGITQLCGRIRPHALSLVDSFAIPDACLGAPIARTDIFDPLEG
jgi:acyl-CoA oxidase